MAITTDQLLIGIAITGTLVTVAGYYGNKYGKIQKERDKQRDRDVSQDLKFTKLVSEQDEIRKQVTHHANKLDYIVKLDMDIKLLKLSFETFKPQFMEIKNDIKKIYDILIENDSKLHRYESLQNDLNDKVKNIKEVM